MARFGGTIMAKAYIYLAAELTKKQADMLKKDVEGKELTFEYQNSDLDLDGTFIDSGRWQGLLWATLGEEVAGLKTLGKPKKVQSNIDSPGTYALEVETTPPDKSYTPILKAKIKIKQKSGDKTTPRIKRGATPKHVKLITKADLKAYRGAPEDLKDLGKQMTKTASYIYTGGTLNGWQPQFNKHYAHEDSGTKGWKAYIDEPSMGTGTKWRLYFNTDFDAPSQTLTVTVTDCKQDH